MKEWSHIPPIEFQTLVESMPRCTEAVLAQHPIKALYCGVSFWLLPVCCVMRGIQYTAAPWYDVCRRVGESVDLLDRMA